MCDFSRAGSPSWGDGPRVLKFTLEPGWGMAFLTMDDPLPPVGSPNALFYAMGYIDAARGIKVERNPFTPPEGAPKLSYILWLRGHEDYRKEAGKTP